MGIEHRSVKFEDSLPEPAEILNILRDISGININLTINSKNSCEFSFEPPDSKVPSETIIMSFFHKNRSITVGYGGEGFHKLPEYYNYVGMQALLDLGGQTSIQMPFYSKIEWSEWVRLNGGATLPLWKKIIKGLYFIVAMLIFGLPIIIFLKLATIYIDIKYYLFGLDKEKQWIVDRLTQFDHNKAKNEKLDES